MALGLTDDEQRRVNEQYDHLTHERLASEIGRGCKDHPVHHKDCPGCYVVLQDFARALVDEVRRLQHELMQLKGRDDLQS